MGSYHSVNEILSTKLLEQSFREVFLQSFDTLLIGGAEEPLYLPADEDCQHHRLFYREDYISSAFHEIAHWCIAGEARRLQVDYGYWYQPDGRNKQQQRSFESVEVKPQAVEWHLSVAAGHRFYLSADNLNGSECSASKHFADAVCQQALHYCWAGLPPRATMLANSLQQMFATQHADPKHYCRKLL